VAGRADRAELGYGDEPVCIVTVGGSGVGAHLLRRVIAAYPAARERVPGLRIIVVAGPRIDPASLPAHDGLEIRPYVDELYRHLAVCDLAVVQGGLTTAMELTACRRPFLYFPLREHFEQNRMSGTGWSGTARGGTWSMTRPVPRRLRRRSPRRWAARSTTGRLPAMARPARQRCWVSCFRGSCRLNDGCGCRDVCD
ncbi:MAG: glycosyltransferase, partial [Streptosporangiaceae bacterium]